MRMDCYFWAVCRNWEDRALFGQHKHSSEVRREKCWMHRPHTNALADVRDSCVHTASSLSMGSGTRENINVRKGTSAAVETRAIESLFQKRERDTSIREYASLWNDLNLGALVHSRIERVERETYWCRFVSVGPSRWNGKPSFDDPRIYPDTSGNSRTKIMSFQPIESNARSLYLVGIFRMCHCSHFIRIWRWKISVIGRFQVSLALFCRTQLR